MHNRPWGLIPDGVQSLYTVIVKSLISRIDLHLVKQTIKWTVYTLLLVNFYFYIMEDIHRATHSLEVNAPLIKWMQEYSTSIDYMAWLVLIAIFELDTYILDENHFTSFVERITWLIRMICYFFLGYTVYAYGMELYETYFDVEYAENVSDLCEVRDRELSFVSNSRYRNITRENCDGLGTGTEFYFLDDGLVITDQKNLQGERTLAWLDLIEVSCWLMIMILIELVIRIQTKGVTEGKLVDTVNYLKICLYTIILACGVYWSLNDHVLYLWDEMLWIGGFAAIEMNIVDWREKLHQEVEATPY